MQFVYLVLLFFSTSYADELSQGESSSAFLTASEVHNLEKPKTCTPKEFEARKRQYFECEQNFSKFGIQETVKPNERMDLSYCPKSGDAAAHFAAGCTIGLLSMPIGVFNLAISALGVDKYTAVVLRECGAKPRFQFENVRLKEGQRPEEQETQYKWQKRIGAYEKCASRVAYQRDLKEKADKAKRRARRKFVLNTFKTINEECILELPKNLRQARIFSPKKSGLKKSLLLRCRIKRSNALGCNECVQELQDGKVDYVNLMYTLYEQELGKYSGTALQCYNPMTVGELFCEALTSVAGGVYGAYKISKKLGPRVKQAILKQVQRVKGNSFFRALPKEYSISGHTVSTDTSFYDSGASVVTTITKEGKPAGFVSTKFERRVNGSVSMRLEGIELVDESGVRSFPQFVEGSNVPDLVENRGSPSSAFFRLSSVRNAKVRPSDISTITTSSIFNNRTLADLLLSRQVKDFLQKNPQATSIPDEVFFAAISKSNTGRHMDMIAKNVDSSNSVWTFSVKPNPGMEIPPISLIKKEGAVPGLTADDQSFISSLPEGLKIPSGFYVSYSKK